MLHQRQLRRQTKRGGRGQAWWDMEYRWGECWGAMLGGHAWGSCLGSMLGGGHAGWGERASCKRGVCFGGCSCVSGSKLI